MSAASPRIAVWVDVSTHVGRGVVGGVVNAARARGWRLTHELIDIDGAIADDGATVIGGLPAVRVMADDPALPSVICDEPAIATLAIDHFRDRGFRHFLFVGDEDTDDARGDAFVLALERTLPARTHTFAREDALHTFSNRELTEWLHTLPRPLACLSANDTLAARVVRCDATVAVLGVGNDPLVCEFAAIPISSIDLNAHQIGVRAAEMLWRQIARKKTKPAIVPPLSVVTRASTDVLAIDDEDVAAALRFIRANTGSRIGIGDLMRASQLTRRSLERRFAKHLGRSPAEVLRRHRVERARQLLAGTDAPISDIARQCGFTLAQHLATAFKQTFGQTPTEYRKHVRATAAINDV